MNAARTQLAFVNIGHAADHYFMLIFPTVVLALAPELGLSYGEALSLSFGGFLAFGAASLPAGWLGDRWSRRGMMIVFFVGIGAASILAGFASSPWQIALALTLIGVFAAIYHPVGLALLVTDPARIGRALGWNGLCGNLGVAFAALATGALVDLFGWRVAFFLPGVLSILAGILFARLVPREAAGTGRRRVSQHIERGTMIRVFAALLIATTAGGVVFNAVTIAMPKIFDERLADLTQTTFGIGALV
jgi:MFS family permease